MKRRKDIYRKTRKDGGLKSEVILINGSKIILTKKQYKQWNKGLILTGRLPGKD